MTLKISWGIWDDDRTIIIIYGFMASADQSVPDNFPFSDLEIDICWQDTWNTVQTKSRTVEGKSKHFEDFLNTLLDSFYWLFFQFSSGGYWPLFSCLSTLDSWWLLDYPAVNCFIRIIGPPASWSLVIVNGYKILSQPTFNKNWNISRGSIPTHFNKLEFTHGARSRFKC